MMLYFMSKPMEAELTHISLLSGILENSESNLQQSSGYSIGLYTISIFVCTNNSRFNHILIFLAYFLTIILKTCILNVPPICLDTGCLGGPGGMDNAPK